MESKQGDEFELQWGPNGLVVRHAFVCDVTLRPGKGSSKTSVSFWEAKTMLDALGVHFDHARAISKNQDPLLVVRLFFFKRSAYESAYATVSGQPNHSVFHQGNSVDIQIAQIESSTAPLPSVAPGFDQKMKGARPDTIHVKGLPAKWFDVNTSSFLDDSIDAPTANGAIYMQDDHVLHRLFNQFGPLSAIEVLPPAADADAESLVSTSQFDVYVQFKDYASLRNAMSALAGRVLCHASHVKALFSLDVHVDTSEYLSDASIRRRRFAREQRVHDAQAKAAQAEAAEKERLASIEDATAQVAPLQAELEALARRLDDELDLSSLPELTEAKTLWSVLDATPTTDAVRAVRAAIDAATKQIDYAVYVKDEQAVKAKRTTWKKHVEKSAEASEAKLVGLQARLEETKATFGDHCDHPAVIADLKAANEALAVGAKSAIPMVCDSLAKAVDDADVQRYLDKLSDDVDEASYMVDAVVARLNVLEEYYKAERAVKGMANPEAFHAMDRLHAIEQEWGASTDELKAKITAVSALVGAVDRAAALVAR
ncbi:hypothetical protein As57867_014261, partial [Aphanomyces stellatus]